MAKLIHNWWIVIIFGFLAAVTNILVLISDYTKAVNQTSVNLNGFYFKGGASLFSLVLYILGIWVVQYRYNSQIRRTASTELRNVLKQAVATIIPEEYHKHTRANIMMPSKGERLNVTYSWNMENYQDRNFFLEIGKGCAGVAWENAGKTPASLRAIPTVEPDLVRAGQYGMTPGQKKMTEHLKWIISTPILRNDDASLVGVFNLDGVENLPTEFFDNPELPNLCISWATIFSETLEDFDVI